MSASEPEWSFPPRLVETSDDPELPTRLQRLERLGVGDHQDQELDDVAKAMAEAMKAPFAMVNLVVQNGQFFAGLHAPTYSGPDLGLAAAPEPVGREMDLDHGYCPHVVARKRALVLDDVCDFPRFQGNHVVDRVGIRSYLGAPLTDSTGTTLGTVCVVDTDPHEWGREGLAFIKHQASHVVELLERRRRRN